MPLGNVQDVELEGAAEDLDARVIVDPDSAGVAHLNTAGEKAAAAAVREHERTSRRPLHTRQH